MVNLVFLASKGIQKSFFLPGYEAFWKAIALGEHCIKIISDKSNSVAMFLRIQADGSL